MVPPVVSTTGQSVAMLWATVETAALVNSKSPWALSVLVFVGGGKGSVFEKPEKKPQPESTG